MVLVVWVVVTVVVLIVVFVIIVVVIVVAPLLRSGCFSSSHITFFHTVCLSLSIFLFLSKSSLSLPHVPLPLFSPLDVPTNPGNLPRPMSSRATRLHVQTRRVAAPYYLVWSHARHTATAAAIFSYEREAIADRDRFPSRQYASTLFSLPC